MKWLKIIVVVFAVLWIAGYITQQVGDDRGRRHVKTAWDGGEFNDYLQFQGRCGAAPYNKPERRMADGLPAGDQVLTYPDRHVSVLFSGRHKDNYLKFDRVTFFYFPSMRTIEPETALSRLGCSPRP